MNLLEKYVKEFRDMSGRDVTANEYRILKARVDHEQAQAEWKSMMMAGMGRRGYWDLCNTETSKILDTVKKNEPGQAHD